MTTEARKSDNGAAAYRAAGYAVLLVLVFGSCLVGLVAGLAVR